MTKISEREKERMYELIVQAFPEDFFKGYSGCLSDAIRRISKEVFDSN